MRMTHLSSNRKVKNKPSWKYQQIDPAIKFTVDGNQENDTIPSLDTLVKPEADKSLSITVYRKPMHTIQYLEWDSHHNLAVKYSLISTLTHRAKLFALDQSLFIRKYNTTLGGLD